MSRRPRRARDLFLAVVLLLGGCGGTGVPLWRVTSGEATSLVLGTYHRGVPAAELPAFVWEALEGSRRLVLEADLSTVVPAEFDALVTLPGLQGTLSAEDWLLLVERVGGLISPGRLGDTQPWFIESTYVNSFFPEGPGMDVELQERAAAAGLDLSVLETWQYQTELLNSLPQTEAVAALLDTVRDPALTAQQLRAGADAYRRADIEALTSLWFDPAAVAAQPAWYAEIVHRRNREWLQALSALLAAGDAFVAVGVVHLLGEPSVLTLLRDAGLEVEPAFTALP